MAHLSPAVYLVWALLSISLGSFLLYHLWSFDRFQSLKWNHGPHAGAFKRIMTYAYFLSIPLITIYSVGFTIIKYIYGFTDVPGRGIMPTPYQLWSQSAQNAIIPLYLSFSVTWGLEMVSHLEELCFWFFLINSGSAQEDWFRSSYFKTWAVGSCIAILTIPLVTIFTREDLYKCEAYTFLVGGLGSLLLTVSFLPILWRFPSFLANLKQHGVDAGTLVRLTTFHELNCIRVVFRFLFTIPATILGIDAIRPHQYINNKLFATDLLAILAGIGCLVSSGLTLVIFFPRSIEGEMTQREQQHSRRKQRTQKNVSRQNRVHLTQNTESPSYVSIAHSKMDLDQFDGASLGAQPNASLSFAGSSGYAAGVPVRQDRPSRLQLKKATLESVDYLDRSISLKPNRLNPDGDVELGVVLTGGEVELIRARSKRGVNSLVHQWRSPIEIGRPPMVSRGQYVDNTYNVGFGVRADL